jgi:hypothetical protein
MLLLIATANNWATPVLTHRGGLPLIDFIAPFAVLFLLSTTAPVRLSFAMAFRRGLPVLSFLKITGRPSRRQRLVVRY